MTSVRPLICNLARFSATFMIKISQESSPARVHASEHACLTLERLVSASMRRSIVSLVVAAWWGCVAEVSSATLAHVQVVTARREEAISPMRTPDQHSLNLKIDHCDYSHTDVNTFPPFLKNTFPHSTPSSFMDIQHFSYSPRIRF